MILGGANPVFSEYEALRRIIGTHAVIAVNDIGGKAPSIPLLAWATLHPEKIGMWTSPRQAPGPLYVFSPAGYAHMGNVTHRLEDRWSGSSGLYAVQVAIEAFGFERIILCGVPMDPTHGHVRGLDHWEWADSFRSAWVRASPHLKNRVRSMSGWTGELLGVPTPEWLIEGEPDGRH